MLFTGKTVSLKGTSASLGEASSGLGKVTMKYQPTNHCVILQLEDHRLVCEHWRISSGEVY